MLDHQLTARAELLAPLFEHLSQAQVGPAAVDVALFNGRVEKPLGSRHARIGARLPGSTCTTRSIASS